MKILTVYTIVINLDAWHRYTCFVEDGFEGLDSSTVPEMQRSDLAPVILQMKALGVSNVVRFNFLSVTYPSPAVYVFHF